MKKPQPFTLRAYDGYSGAYIDVELSRMYLSKYGKMATPLTDEVQEKIRALLLSLLPEGEPLDV